MAAAAGSTDSDVQVVRRQPRDDLQHGLRSAEQVGRNLGADAVRLASLISRRRLVHLEEHYLDGDAHINLADALDQIVHGLVVPIDKADWCFCTLTRLHWRADSGAGARPLPGLSVPLLAGIKGSIAGSVHTTLAKGHQEEQDQHDMGCTKAAR